MCIPTTSFAADSDSYKETVYQHILNDYLQITKLETPDADSIYEKITSADLKNVSVEQIETLVYKENRNAKYEETVLYIQDNYDQIVNGLSNEEKEMIDEYFLEYALQYYVDYGSPQDFVQTPVSRDNFINEPIFIDNEEFENYFVDEEEIVCSQINGTRSSNVASVRIFADPTQSNIGSSGLSIDVGTHAWITVSNISNSTITVGKFNVAAGKTMALGTWGNKAEHTGLWYNLESYLISKNSAYGGRVSLRVDITQANLTTLNKHMVGYDKWSITTNCSSFAVSSWNKVCSTTLSAGVINTPKNLANSIKAVSGYSTGHSVPHNYIVYYANGSGSPIASTVYK